MEINTLTLATFSPTGTGERVARAIADGLGQSVVNHIDLTRPEVRKQSLHLAKGTVLIIAVPVYMGRVPALLDEWFESLAGDHTPAVCVVVYGNRAYENALLELKDRVTAKGCVPAGCAAYIGEHSFSTPEVPTAHGRPDADDLSLARDFGTQLRERFTDVGSPHELTEVQVPGTTPYGGVTELWDVDFIIVSDNCVQCGQCAAICPMEAIDPADSADIDITRCITCCACLKACPEGARTMNSGPVMDARIRLNKLFHDRKKPEHYL